MRSVSQNLNILLISHCSPKRECRLPRALKRAMRQRHALNARLSAGQPIDRVAWHDCIYESQPLRHECHLPKSRAFARLPRASPECSSHQTIAQLLSSRGIQGCSGVPIVCNFGAAGSKSTRAARIDQLATWRLGRAPAAPGTVALRHCDCGVLVMSLGAHSDFLRELRICERIRHSMRDDARLLAAHSNLEAHLVII